MKRIDPVRRSQSTPRHIIVAGGVACNAGLRGAAQAATNRMPNRFCSPLAGLSTETPP